MVGHLERTPDARVDQRPDRMAADRKQRAHVRNVQKVERQGSRGGDADGRVEKRASVAANALGLLTLEEHARWESHVLEEADIWERLAWL